jgi:hypothetical protein
MSHLKLLLFCSLFTLIVDNAFSQCTTKIDFRVEPDEKGSNSISIKSLDGPRSMKIQLYDLNEGKVVDEKETVFNDSYTLTFKNVRSSFYMFYLWLPNCKKPSVFSGQRHGIRIEN